MHTGAPQEKFGNIHYIIDSGPKLKTTKILINNKIFK